MTYLLHLLHNLFFKQYKKSIHQQKLWFCSLLHRIRSARICYYTPAACKGRKGHRTNFHHVWPSRMQRSIIIGRMVNCPSRYASLGEREFYAFTRFDLWKDRENAAFTLPFVESTVLLPHENWSVLYDR